MGANMYTQQEAFARMAQSPSETPSGSSKASGNTASTTAKTASKEPVREVVTRFGAVTIDAKKSIGFPKGILGMPDKTEFCLADFPLEAMPHFKLLQSTQDDELAFVTLPINIENPFVQSADIQEGCNTLGITADNLALLLVVSVHRRVDGVNLSVNARAPIFIDSVKRTAEQYVLPNSAYEIRQMLAGAKPEPAGKSH